MPELRNHKNHRVLFAYKEGKRVIPDLNEETIDKLAQELDCLTGKWLLFIGKEEVDKKWEKIKDFVKERSGLFAKVSTAVEKKKGNHVICVYTQNYLDREEVMKVREDLRELEYEGELRYKPDIYTILGIYPETKSDFGLKEASKYSA